MLVNIHDIAKLAGVSVSTVSKVMNGKDKDISEKTKQRVLKVIEEEQYIPYLKFREKEGLKSHLIGLVLKKDNREGDRIIHSAPVISPWEWHTMPGSTVRPYLSLYQWHTAFAKRS